MAWPFNKEPEKPKQAEVEPVEDLDSNTAVIEAEQVVISAFRIWVGKSGLSERRVQTILNSVEGSAKGRLQGSREYSLVWRAADNAIRMAYETVDDLDKLDAMLN